jgi:hypothetical protein
MGFWGDIMCSPYFAIGIDSDTPNKHAEGLYEIINKVRPLAPSTIGITCALLLSWWYLLSAAE